MKTFAFSCIFLCSLIHADPARTIAYIDALLSRQDGNIAILLVDMQTGFYENFFDRDEAQKVISSQLEVLTHYIGNKRVVFVDVNFTGQEKTLPELMLAIKQRSQYHFFLKEDYSAFEGINLGKPWDIAQAVPGRLKPFLQKNGVTDVVPMGCFDAACVRATAKGAKEAGFNVLVDRDLNISFNQRTKIRFGWTDEDVKKFCNKKWAEVMKDYPDIKVIPRHEEQPPCS